MPLVAYAPAAVGATGRAPSDEMGVSTDWQDWVSSYVAADVKTMAETVNAFLMARANLNIGAGERGCMAGKDLPSGKRHLVAAPVYGQHFYEDRQARNKFWNRFRHKMKRGAEA